MTDREEAKPRRTRWNSTLPAPTKPLARGKPPKKRNERRKGHRFPKAVNESFRRFIRRRPCLIKRQHRCIGEVQCCHVKARGAGGVDVGNCWPGCYGAHDEQTRIGIRAFNAKYGVVLAETAARLAEAYDEESEAF